MRTPLVTLNDIKVANPCNVPWDSMPGNDRMRFCSHCQLPVYNISGMTTEQAMALLQQNDWQVCVGFYRRWDGTVLTADCSSGTRKLVRHPWGWAKASLASLLAAALALFGAGCGQRYQGKPGKLDFPSKEFPPQEKAQPKAVDD